MLYDGPKPKQFTEPPVIIGGCGRSGTTLLLSVLSAHSRICAIPQETYAFCSPAYESPPSMEPRLLIKEFYESLGQSEIPVQFHRWCEKSPKNVLFFGPLLDAFGDDLKLIHVVRDGRDVITSKHPQRPSEFWIRPERWIVEVSAGLKYEAHDQVYTLRYEDLVLDFEITIRKLLEFIEEEFEDRMLEWHKHALVRQNIAWKGEVKDMYGDSVGRWNDKQFEEHVDHFMSDAAAAALMQRLAYQ